MEGTRRNPERWLCPALPGCLALLCLAPLPYSALLYIERREGGADPLMPPSSLQSLVGIAEVEKLLQSPFALH